MVQGLDSGDDPEFLDAAQHLDPDVFLLPRVADESLHLRHFHY